MPCGAHADADCADRTTCSSGWGRSVAVTLNTSCGCCWAAVARGGIWPSATVREVHTGGGTAHSASAV
eukprot:733839-Pelagomonas_calceolata.AAC.4